MKKMDTKIANERWEQALELLYNSCKPLIYDDISPKSTFRHLEVRKSRYFK